MICESCKHNFTCNTVEAIRVTKQWCPRYVYSAAMERQVAKMLKKSDKQNKDKHEKK